MVDDPVGRGLQFGDRLGIDLAPYVFCQNLAFGDRSRPGDDPPTHTVAVRALLACALHLIALSDQAVHSAPHFAQHQGAAGPRLGRRLEINAKIPAITTPSIHVCIGPSEPRRAVDKLDEYG